MRRNLPFLIAAAAAVGGLVFASFSTHDFVQHLDRQVHGLQCSFLPGLAEADVSGASGCHVTLMSPYSSVLRDSVWGGIPISLPAMAVFAFLAAFAAFVSLTGRQHDRRATGFFALAWALPVLASVVMGYIALATLDAACKLCIGIYASSAVGLAASLVGLFARPAPSGGEADAPGPPSLSYGALGAAFGAGVLFVVAPVAAYAAAAPDFSRFVGGCGTLPDPSDASEVLIPIGPQTRTVPVIEVLDPLCPACKGFEARFDASSVAADASRRVLLFPLDDRCNWMIDRAIHPGACAVSEAVLCADRDAEEVIEWAFANQAAITEAARADPDAAARMARERFPSLADCIGSPTVQARLNQSLRWAVQNQLPVLTPQVYVGDLRLCDADTDLGMDYALSRLAARWREGPHTPRPPASVAPSEPRAPTAPRSVRVGSPASAPAPATPGAAPRRAPAPPVLEAAPEPPAAEPEPAAEPAPEPSAGPPEPIAEPAPEQPSPEEAP